MYLGIVVQNDDPDRAGKIKVYVPHIAASVYENWVQNDTDKKFKFPGGNIDSDLNTIIEPLKAILPWARCAMPLVGASGSGRYNAHTKTGTISDTARLTETEQDPGYSKTDHSLNTDGIGEKPGRVYEKYDLKLTDAFSDAENTSVNNVNPLTHNYTPSTYSNMSKGSFSIPNVGSHVWVFFESGDPLEPVYFAVSYGDKDWQSIFDITAEDRGQDYPGTYENASKDQDKGFTTDTETYRNKFVINQKGGSLEFVNTDNREILKMTHYSGSFKEFNNKANVELATHNDQKLILNDQFETVNGSKNSYVERDYDFIVRGDRFKKIGSLDVDNMKQWRNVMAAVADVKQLFDIKRATANTWTSPDQQQSGQFAPCPVCNPASKQFDPTMYGSIQNEFKNVGFKENTETPGCDEYPTAMDCGASGCPTVSKELGHTLTQGVTVDPKQYAPYSILTPQPGKVFGETCPSCGGSGISPSTMDGTWQPEDKKEIEAFKKVILDAVEELVEVERELGLGGSEDIIITKHKTETIGTVMNDFGSIRVDTAGKMYNDKVVIHKEGVLVSKKETPLIEYSHVDDLPGGSYNLNVCNKYNVQVGAGGLSMKSYGPVDISGTIVNVTGEQVNVSSANEVNIDGGKRLSLVGDIISIRQRKREQVLIDSSLGITRNLIVNGASHFEGEVHLHHVTAPCEIQETQNTKIYGRANHEKTLIIGYTWNGIPCGIPGCSYNPVYSRVPNIDDSPCAVADHDSLYMYPHSHYFKNLPLSLKNENDKVRQDAKVCNSGARGKTKKREWKNAGGKSEPVMAGNSCAPPPTGGGFGGLGGGIGGGLGGALGGGLGGALGGISGPVNLDTLTSLAASPAGGMLLNAATGGLGGPALAAGMTLLEGGSLEDAAGAAAEEAIGGMVPGGGGIPGGDLPDLPV